MPVLWEGLYFHLAYQDLNGSNPTQASQQDRGADEKNPCVFAGLYVVQEIVSSCSVVIMRNRLPIFEGFPLPAAEEILYFLRKRMVPFSALCRRDFFFSFWRTF